MLDEILLGLEIVARIVGSLTAAKDRAERGMDLTPDQRRALDAVLALKASELLDAIDARIGPDPDDAGGPPAAPITWVNPVTGVPVDGGTTGDGTTGAT